MHTWLFLGPHCVVLNVFLILMSLWCEGIVCSGIGPESGSRMQHNPALIFTSNLAIVFVPVAYMNLFLVAFSLLMIPNATSANGTARHVVNKMRVVIEKRSVVSYTIVN